MENLYREGISSRLWNEEWADGIQKLVLNKKGVY